ncbi:MAG TPA: HTTM domain-containing protein, partial [bacterium]|nr:HTTM domain-containing protein [bacterium]
MAKLKELFGIDIRSLALFRIGLGLIVLTDLISRSADLRAFYTDAGVLPRSALLENPTYFWPVSLHMLNGSPAFQVFLFLLTGLAALALTFGYRTRIAAFACWILVTSLHARNQFINQAGDTLLHLYLFWGLFLPLAACCSVDRGAGAADPKIPKRIFSGGTVALLLQICFVYWFAAINKSGALWRDGTALFYVFSLDTMVKPAGTFLLGYPGLIKFLANFTIWIESWGPFLAF